MARTLNFLYRGGLILLAVGLLWSLWVSAQETTTNPPGPLEALSTPATNGLVARLGHLDENYVSFGLNRIEFLRAHSLFGEPLWKYAASVLFVFLAFYASKFVDFLTRVWLKKLANRTQTSLDNLFLELLNGPVKIVTFVIFLHVGLGIFQWPPAVKTLLSKGLIVIMAASITYMLVKLMDLLLGIWIRRATGPDDDAFHKQLFPIIRRTLKTFVVIVALLVTAQNLGINITGLIASLSIGGLALGLAAQDTLANMFGAVSVLLDKPFKVGDSIRLDSVDGVVETIGFRSTRVRNGDGHLVTIPNKTMGNAIITNVTLRPNIRTLMNLGITYDSGRDQIQAATDILKEVFLGHPNTRDAWISFNKFGDSSLNLSVVHWWNNTDHKAYLAGMHAMNLEIKQRFDQAGIRFAFPTQTLYVRQDSGWRFEDPGLMDPSSKKQQPRPDDDQKGPESPFEVSR